MLSSALLASNHVQHHAPVSGPMLRVAKMLTSRMTAVKQNRNYDRNACDGAY